jgi:hypothetical protein
MGLSTWVLVSVVELKEDSSMIKGELFQINQTLVEFIITLIINETLYLQIIHGFLLLVTRLQMYQQ